jgi:hypothetical protein
MAHLQPDRPDLAARIQAGEFDLKPLPLTDVEHGQQPLGPAEGAEALAPPSPDPDRAGEQERPAIPTRAIRISTKRRHRWNNERSIMRAIIGALIVVAVVEFVLLVLLLSKPPVN